MSSQISLLITDICKIDTSCPSLSSDFIEKRKTICDQQVLSRKKSNQVVKNSH
ncbi:hypothetical protein H359_0268 [Chlamydia ibidis 10-1398/6]|uniref:Uncharacterized protein n=1 Tax=Chlamydia ibidis 10-1398/6 TaxID=1046581 RepID=A0ABN0N053_9CHLA|nr:hypothetical protein H359_0268 [Chlamydia ibidis 10-1398/6]